MIIGIILIFKIVNVLFLDGGVYISQLICFVRMYSNVDYFNKRNLYLTAKLFNQIKYVIKFEKHFLNSTTDTQG